MLDIRDLRHDYSGRTVLSVPEWHVPAGARSLVLGPSGSGKSTLLAIVAGLVKPSSGRVQVAGEDMGAMKPSRRDAFRARHVGLVPQKLHLVGVLDVRANLRLARSLAGLDPGDGIVDLLLEGLGLAELARRKAARLSVGEAQRVAIARAVVNRPNLILADEPTSALDDANCERALDLIAAQAEACGATLVVATHDRRVKDRFVHRLEL